MKIILFRYLLQTAIDELISPLTNDRFISTWQQELLVHTLLVQDMPNLALRALRAPGPPIGTVLEIKTLLANNLITEAFELQRTKYDDDLLLEFYKGCHHLKKWNYVFGLALTEREGQVLLKFLRSNESLLSENLQLLYLLQRNKYIEALTHLDGLKCRQRPASLQRQLDNTQGTIFSAFKMGLVPSDRKLSDLFLSVKDRVGSNRDRAGKGEEMKPFSSDLNAGQVDSNTNIIGDLFHRAILSAKSTSASLAAAANNREDGDDGMQGYVPFLSKPSIDFDYFECKSNKAVKYPTTYLGATKRRKETAFEDKCEPDYSQPAAKRQRTTEPRPQMLQRSSAHGLTDDSQDDDDEFDETVNLLSTPAVKSSRNEKHATDQSSRCQTPQSILKSGASASRRSVSPTLTVNSARRSVDFDERSFRFAGMPSTTANSSAEEYRLSAIPESVADTETDQMEISPYGGIRARMPLHVADTSAQSTSADEYFSPENTELSARLYESKEIIERHFEEMSDDSNDSIEEEIVSKPPEEENNRKRSASREPITPLLSTRLTRSKSNLNLEVDAADGKRQLDTSTPLRTISGRRSLANAAIEANASKLPCERHKRIDEATKSTSTRYSATADGNKSYPNILDDDSELNESQIQKYSGNKSVYSDVSTAYTPNARSRRNILEDSSAYADIFSYSDVPSISDEKKVEQVTKTDAPELMDTNESEVISTGDTTDEKSNTEEQPSKDGKSIERESVDNAEPLKESVEEAEHVKQVKESETIVKSVEKIKSTAGIEPPPSTSNVTQGSTVNILTDNSNVTESFVRRYAHTENTTVYSETSTIFYSSTRATNILEESSFGPTLAPHSIKDVTETPPFDLLESQSSSDIDDHERDDANKEKYESDVEEINYDSNDSNECNESIQSHNSSSASQSEQSTSRDSSASSNQEDNVINISSGSEDSVTPNRDERVTSLNDEISEEAFVAAAIEFAHPDPPLASHVLYSLPSGDRPTPTDNYIITDMFSTSMDELPDSSADLLPPQSITDIVYGDLDTISMDDVTKEDEIYVGEAISLETQPQDNILESIETTSQIQTVVEIVPETLSTEIERGFVDDGETLAAMASIKAASSEVAKSVGLPLDAEAVELAAAELVAVADELNVGCIANEASAQEKKMEEEMTHFEEETNVFEQAVVVDQTDSGAVERIGTDGNIANTSALKTNVVDQPSTSSVPAKNRRRSVSVSSEKGQSVTGTVDLPLKRSTRAKSVATDVMSTPTTPKLRPRRAVSQQNLDKIAETSPAHIKTRRQSSTPDTITELPTKKPTTRRRKASESTEVESAKSQLPETPRRNLRSRVSDAESVTSTPSSHRGMLTPQHEPRRTRSKCSATRDDDEESETSSVASSVRSTRSLRTPITEIDDDTSMRSTRSTKRTYLPSTLPPIDEDAAPPSKTLSTDILESSRVTRGQKANLEKYLTKQRQPEKPAAARTPRKVAARRQSTIDSIVDAENITDRSDTESLASDTSKLSRTSKASRSSKRIRSKKA